MQNFFDFCFDREFPESVGTLLNLQKSAISYLFSDPRLQLVKLNEEEYSESQIVYRSRDNEKEAILKAILQTINPKLLSQDSVRILSIGCGQGIFEKPFLQNIIERDKAIHFVGIEPKKKEGKKIQEWCNIISFERPRQFSFEIHSVGFEEFESDRSFDIILFINSLYYFSELKPSIQKSYQLINKGGIAIATISPKRKLLNEPYYYVNQRLYGQSRWFSEALENALIESKISFIQEKIEFFVNITECFQKGSQSGKQLLDFMIGANTAYFSPLQLRLLLDYLASGSHKMDTGEVMLPHSVDLFYFEKE